MYLRGTLHIHTGWEGIMDNIVGEGVRFERIRRITGYLVGTLERFNDAKAAEVRDRVTHMTFKKWQKDHKI